MSGCAKSRLPGTIRPQTLQVARFREAPNQPEDPGAAGHLDDLGQLGRRREAAVAFVMALKYLKVVLAAHRFSECSFSEGELYVHTVGIATPRECGKT